MKLSFVIPAYNEEELIGQCLDSILKQMANMPLEEIEIIVVNNASTDKTREVALSFPRITVVNELRPGITHARQAGLHASSGEFIIQLDADTLLPNGYIETAMKEFDKDQALVAISSGPIVYYDISKTNNNLVSLFYYFVYAIYAVNRYVLRVGSVLQGGNAIIRRSALEKINGYNSNYSFYGEDADLARRLYEIGKVKFVLKFPTYTSGRRLAKEGMMLTAAKYAINYLSAVFFKKPLTKKYTNIR